MNGEGAGGGGERPLAGCLASSDSHSTQPCNGSFRIALLAAAKAPSHRAGVHLRYSVIFSSRFSLTQDGRRSIVRFCFCVVTPIRKAEEKRCSRTAFLHVGWLQGTRRRKMLGSYSTCGLFLRTRIEADWMLAFRPTLAPPSLFPVLVTVRSPDSSATKAFLTHW